MKTNVENEIRSSPSVYNTCPSGIADDIPHSSYEYQVFFGRLLLNKSPSKSYSFGFKVPAWSCTVTILLRKLCMAASVAPSPQTVRLK